MIFDFINPDDMKCINDNEKQGALTFTSRFHHFTSEHEKKTFLRYLLHNKNERKIYNHIPEYIDLTATRYFN